VKQPKIISFDVWTVASVRGDRPAAIPDVKAPAPKAEEVPINEDDIKAGYIEALTPFGSEPFSLPNTIKVTNDYAKSIGSESIKAQYTVMKNKTKYLEALVLDGVLEKSPDGKYKFVDGVL